MLLEEKSEEPLYIQLYQQIKQDILTGNIRVGTKLPSSRNLAIDLHISRNTVELAYEQLTAEGFLKSKPRQGCYAELPLLEAMEKKEIPESARVESEIQTEGSILYDFRNKKLHPDDFPFDKWQKLVNICFQEYKDGFLQYGCPLGEPGLRSEIHRYIHKYRQVNCKAKQIIIGSGTQFCLELVCQLLKLKSTNVAMEEPGYDRTRTTFQNNGLSVHPVELDAHGINVKTLSTLDVAAAYVTPSHQHPTGIIMSAERRQEMVEWARQNETYIIEDDYNHCFQYDLKPLPSLQSLSNDRVIYMGSFSNTLFPAIGIAYLVLPEHLLDELCKRYCSETIMVPFLTQKTLELFMRDGIWEKHLRKTVQHQRKKRNALVSALQNELGDNIDILGYHAGLHVLVQAKWEITEDELIGSASKAGVEVGSTSNFRSCPSNEANRTVLLYYGGMKLEHIPAAIGILSQAWLKNTPGAIQNLKTGSCTFS